MTENTRQTNFLIDNETWISPHRNRPNSLAALIGTFKVFSIPLTIVKRDIYRLCSVGGLLLLMTGSNVSAQDLPKFSRGTVNIALQNENGIVLVTDSVQSHKDHSGAWKHETPFQKLFRLDDKTVCSIAGFGSETGWPSPQLNTDVTGIIADFRDQLSTKPVPQFDAKLHALGFLVGFYIDVIANRLQVNAGGVASDDLIFEVIMAGYDFDGKAKLEKLVITPLVSEEGGQRRWSYIITPVGPDGTTMKHLFGGIKVWSESVIANPAAWGENEILAKYIESTKATAPLLSLEEMATLATFMAQQAAADPRSLGLVGPPYQVAILSKGEISRVDQPRFPDPPRPLKFTLFMGLQVEGAINFLTPPDVHMLWIRSKFVAIQNPMLRLDGQFFYGCEIQDSMVEYGGGLTDLGPTNSVVNSMLLARPPIVSLNEFNRVFQSFKWSVSPPATLRLPPKVSPI